MHRICQLVSAPLVSGIQLAQTKCLVTYRLSALGPPTRQIHILENRNLIAARGGSGHRTWAGALHLGHFLSAQANRSLIKGKGILELGAGTGYISILCAKYLGAAHVTASEGNEEVFEGMTDNFALNDCAYSHSHSPSAHSSIAAKMLKWGHGLLGREEAEWTDGHQVDVVLGADITYDQHANPALVSTLRQLLCLFPHADVVLCVTKRNPETWSMFREACRQNQLRVKLECSQLEDSHDEAVAGTGRSSINCPPFYSSCAPIHIYRISSESPCFDP